MESVLAINALRRQPKQEVIVHSDQGSQFSSCDWQHFLKAHNLIASQSRRGNCHDNAVAESFSQLLKRERIRRRIYVDREGARLTCSITSRCFTTRPGDMVTTIACLL